MRVIWSIIFFWAFITTMIAQNKSSPQSSKLEDKKSWVDSVYAQMTLDQRIGQLFTIRAGAKNDKADIDRVLSQIKNYHVGGITFFQGSPSQLAYLNNKYQKASSLPLLISIDGEWGLGMRYPKWAISFPRNLTLGAIQDNTLITKMAQKIAQHCKRLGIHIDFAPVVDVNNNPDNPVINNRSFGEDRFLVAGKGYAYMKGLQDNGIIACAKHFPGHGDTDVDSHKDLPVILHPRKRLDSIELMPFKALIKQGIKSIMVAHLNIPALDNRPNRPTTLSSHVINDLLKGELKFSGLVFSDAMEMKGVTKFFEPGYADREAFLAGNDIILLPENLEAGISAIKKGILDHSIPESRLEESVKKILRAKYDVGLTKWSDLPLNDISIDINDKSSLALKQILYENAMTLVSDEEEIIPIKTLNDKKFVVVDIGGKWKSEFYKTLTNHIDPAYVHLPKKPTGEEKGRALAKIKGADYILVSIHDMSKYSSKRFGIPKETLSFLDLLPGDKPVILTIFGSPYALRYFSSKRVILEAYEDDKLAQKAAAQAILGINDIKGKLPVTASDDFPLGTGEYRAAIGRLGYSIPEAVGVSSAYLEGIDTIISKMIGEKAAPGAQIFVAKNGKIIFDKAYGYFTYEKKHPVTTSDIYDMASVTKICASTISLMKLYDDGKFDINATVDKYIPEADTCNKGDLLFTKVLSHHAKLPGWIPFYKNTVTKPKRKKSKPLPDYYSNTLTPRFNIPVADHLFLRSDYRDTIWARIWSSKLRSKEGYRYSDLAFYIAHKTIKNITGIPVNQYAKENFYDPMGLTNTGYLPLERHDIERIAPTEEDTYFRDQTIRGHVHDMGAAMLGGVSGHAGLFSNARDIGTILQMLLNGGSYAGKRYLDPNTVALFTRRVTYSTRRGLGFDLKELNPNKKQNMSDLASEKTFGHLGFTGIAAFADPEYDLVFVMVTNRTFPTMNNNKYGKHNYRPRVQSQIYRAMGVGVSVP